jgi:hypothetical protein
MPLKEKPIPIHQYPDFWHEIASALNMQVETMQKYEGTDNPEVMLDRAYLVDKEGRKVWLYLIFQTGKWVIEVSSTYPQNPIFGGYRGKPISICVSESRPAGAIAKDIQRRFWPEFVKEHDGWVEQIRNDIEKWREVLERMEELLPNVAMPDEQAKTYRLTRHYSPPGHLARGYSASAAVHAYGSITIEFRGDLDNPMTMAMLTTLFRYAPAGQDNNSRAEVHPCHG